MADTTILVRSAILLLMVTATLSASPASTCIMNNRACVRNSECCGGCCFEEKCVEHADSCAAGQNPCSVYQCPPNKECYLNQVTCNTADCPPLPACRDPDYDDDYV